MLPLVLAVIVLTLAVRPLRHLAGVLLGLLPMAALALGALYLLGLLPAVASTAVNAWYAWLAAALLLSVPLTRMALAGCARLVGPRIASLLHLPSKPTPYAAH